jgi:hypothetical protein
MKPAGADRVRELNEDMAPGTYARGAQNGSPQGPHHPDPARMAASRSESRLSRPSRYRSPGVEPGIEVEVCPE